MKYLEFEQIERLNIEINSACNAACPGCARQVAGIYRNEVYPKNQHMSLGTWTKLFYEVGQQISSVVFCGNYGDAGATNHLPEMLQVAHAMNPNTYYVVVTNLGLNSPEYWKRLGNCIPKHCLQIQCSIDGLEDTNHLYRRFVRWDKVIKNLEALSKTSAQLIWKFIEFDWNSHQIEQARQLADYYNFHDFIVTPNNQPGSDNIFSEWRDKLGDDWNNPSSLTPPPFPVPDWRTLDPEQARLDELALAPEFDTIECYTQQEKSVHIDWTGAVWPCCWYGGAEYHSQPKLRAAQSMLYPDRWTNWNNLNHHTLREILNNDFYSHRLMDSLDTKPSPVCAASCGKCGGKFNSINTIGKNN